MVPATGLRGQPTGAVVAEIDLDKLSTFLDATSTHEGITLSVVSADREVLASTSPAGPMVGRMIGSASEATELIRLRDGVGEWTAEDGTRYLAGVAGLAKARWLVVAATPSTMAYGPAGARFRANLLGLGAVTSLALGVAWLIARQFAAAIRGRRREAESLAGLGRVLAQTLDPVAMAQEIADCVRALIGTHTSGLYRLEPDSGDMVAVAISGDAGPSQGRGIVFPRGTGVASLAAQRAPPHHHAEPPRGLPHRPDPGGPRAHRAGHLPLGAVCAARGA